MSIEKRIGGAIAQYLAVDHSDLVHHLVLTATAYRMSDEAKDLMLCVRDLARQGKGRAVCTTMMGSIYTHGVKKYLFKVLMWLFPSFMFDPTTGPSDGVGEIEAALNHDFKDQLANIQVPTLVIGGNQDFFVPEALIRETADTIPNAKLILYQGLGHEAAFSKQLAADVLAFISNGNV